MSGTTKVALPDTGIAVPDTGTLVPDAGTALPDKGMALPDVVSVSRHGRASAPHAGSALHLVGTTGPKGLDVFFHTAFPVEAMFGGVAFWARADEPVTPLTVGIGGPERLYFADRDQGLDWPQQTFNLAGAWQRIEVDFDALRDRT